MTVSLWTLYKQIKVSSSSGLEHWNTIKGPIHCGLIARSYRRRERRGTRWVIAYEEILSDIYECNLEKRHRLQAWIRVKRKFTRGALWFCFRKTTEYCFSFIYLRFPPLSDDAFHNPFLLPAPHPASAPAKRRGFALPSVPASPFCSFQPSGAASK